ncbi:unnamed protein product [Clonostachys byssicola]|uniref:Uncharacterized protein n=1 Tax=Clonostachys byssicola TaxID=160290 RepID=A0A9N9XY41_9HYPO|nr:unnamed protein product [Clonostachys byssicola]
MGGGVGGIVAGVAFIADKGPHYTLSLVSQIFTFGDVTRLSGLARLPTKEWKMDVYAMIKHHKFL